VNSVSLGRGVDVGGNYVQFVLQVCGESQTRICPGKHLRLTIRYWSQIVPDVVCGSELSVIVAKILLVWCYRMEVLSQAIVSTKSPYVEALS